MRAQLDAIYNGNNKGVSTHKDLLFYNDCYNIYEEIPQSIRRF